MKKTYTLFLILLLSESTKNNKLENFTHKEESEIENYLNNHPDLKEALEIGDSGLTVRRIFLIARAYKKYKDENEAGNIKDFFEKKIAEKFEALKNKLKNIKSKKEEENYKK